MSPAMLFGTAGDHIEVVIGVLLGILLILWVLTVFTQWIMTTPWKRRGSHTEDEAGNVVDGSHPSNDGPHVTPRLAIR